MQSGRNTIVILYKIDIGSEDNIMPLFIFKKLFKKSQKSNCKNPYKAISG